MAQAYEEMAKEITIAVVSSPNFFSGGTPEHKISKVCELYKEILKTIKEE